MNELTTCPPPKGRVCVAGSTRLGATFCVDSGTYNTLRVRPREVVAADCSATSTVYEILDDSGAVIGVHTGSLGRVPCDPLRVQIVDSGCDAAAAAAAAAEKSVCARAAQFASGAFQPSHSPLAPVGTAGSTWTPTAGHRLQSFTVTPIKAAGTPSGANYIEILLGTAGTPTYTAVRLTEEYPSYSWSVAQDANQTAEYIDPAIRVTAVGDAAFMVAWTEDCQAALAARTFSLSWATPLTADGSYTTDTAPTVFVEIGMTVWLGATGGVLPADTVVWQTNWAPGIAGGLPPTVVELPADATHTARTEVVGSGATGNLTITLLVNGFVAGTRVVAFLPQPT